jgi:hypothetical protein
MTARLRERLAQPRVQALVVLLGVLLAAAVIVPRLPHPVEGVATLDQCLWGWPIVAFEGEDWRAALPNSIAEEYRAYAQRQTPVVEWPNGMRVDEAAGVLLDAQGHAVYRKGDRVRVAGTIVETSGDPAPCYYRVGVKIDEIGPP